VPPTIWCACETWPPQFRWRKSEPTYVFSNIELEPRATKTPEIKPFDIIHDEQQKEKHAASQFFRSLLNSKRPPLFFSDGRMLVDKFGQ
jgi:hypothetical protein